LIRPGVEIRDSRLYREDYETFEEHCRDRWDISRVHPFQLVESAKVQKRLLPIGNIEPANEYQVRPLTKLETAGGGMGDEHKKTARRRLVGGWVVWGRLNYQDFFYNSSSSLMIFFAVLIDFPAR
jgi:hypothetical protein